MRDFHLNMTLVDSRDAGGAYAERETMNGTQAVCTCRQEAAVRDFHLNMTLL